MPAVLPYRKPRHLRRNSWVPSRSIEYGYFFVVAYSILSAYLGVEVPLVAAGLTVALAWFCYTHLRSRAKDVCAPIALLLASQVSFILVQIFFHGASVMDEIIRSFVLWICGTVVVQSLCLRRGFLYRCTFVLFAIGLVGVPYLQFDPGQVERVRAGIQLSGNLAHPNGLAGWFGFCAVSFAIFGLEEKRSWVRGVIWLLAVVCLFIAGLTVSRGALLASAIAITVAFRRLLKRGFLPTLLLIIFTGVILESGLFGNIASLYEERGMEETGRLLLWPEAIERIIDSPLIGVGISNIGLYALSPYNPHPPHNSFLFFALSSGVVSLALWISYWIRAAWRSFSIEQQEYGSFQLPFLLYAFVNFMLGDITTVPWVLLTLSVGAGAAVSHAQKHPLVVRRIRGRRTVRSLGRSFKAANP